MLNALHAHRDAAASFATSCVTGSRRNLRSLAGLMVPVACCTESPPLRCCRYETFHSSTSCMGAAVKSQVTSVHCAQALTLSTNFAGAEKLRPRTPASNKPSDVDQSFGMRALQIIKASHTASVGSTGRWPGMCCKSQCRNSRLTETAF